MFNKKGFSLLELLISISVLGILSLMATPKFFDYVEKAQFTQIINDDRVLENLLTFET